MRTANPKRLLARLARYHRAAMQSLDSLGYVVDHCRPEYTDSRIRDGVNIGIRTQTGDTIGKGLVYLRDAYLDWQRFQSAAKHFDCANPSPVELRGIVAANWHAITSEIIRHVLNRVWRVLIPWTPMEHKSPEEQGWPGSFELGRAPLGAIASAVRLVPQPNPPARQSGIRAIVIQDSPDQPPLDNQQITWLESALRQEYARAAMVFRGVSAQQAPVVGDPAQWWHDPSEPRPPDYKYGPVTGTKKVIGRWMGEQPTPTPRRLQQKAKSGFVWVIRHSGTAWEVWFKDERFFDRVDRERRFDK